MELTDKERTLITKLRNAKKNAGNSEVIILYKYIPINENEFIEQVLPGHPKSIFSIRMQMKKLLDDLIAIDQPNSIFTIDYEPGMIRIYQH